VKECLEEYEIKAQNIFRNLNYDHYQNLFKEFKTKIGYISASDQAIVDNIMNIAHMKETLRIAGVKDLPSEQAKKEEEEIAAPMPTHTLI